jgi:hypothetical protein
MDGVARVLLDGGRVVVRLGALERLLALRRRDVVVDAGSIVLANATRQPMVAARGMWWPGYYLAGCFAVGTWRWGGGRDFLALWPTVGPALVLDLCDGEFARVVVSCPGMGDAETLAALLRPRR